MEIRVRRSAHDQLSALPGRCKFGGMAVLDQFLSVLPAPHLNLTHGSQNGSLCFFRCQRSQPCLRRQLNIHAEPVRQQTQLLHQLWCSSWNGLGVDISIKAVLLPQKPQSADHQLSGIVWGAEDARGEEQSLNIVPAIKLDCQICQFLRRKGCPPGIIAAAVDAVFTVIDTAVG